MADISKIKLPDGITYNIKDTVARDMLAHSLELVICPDGLPGPAGSTYQGKIYLVPHTHGTQDIYDEYVVVQDLTTSAWSWEKIGNTDIDMSNYSLKTHKHTVTTNIQVSPHTYTPAGTVGPAVFVGQAATINLTGHISGDIAIVVDTSPASGQANYTPSGRVSVTLSNAGSHTHTIGGTTRYLHKVSVPKTFNTETAVTAISTSKLVRTQVKAVTGTATVSRLTGSTTKNVATVGTDVTIPKFALDSQNTTVHNIGTPSTGDRATGALTSPESGGTNNMMWNAKIDPNDQDGETLMFEFKKMAVASTVTGVTATAVQFKNITADGNETLTPAVANGTVHDYTKTDVTVATTDNNQFYVATGAVASNGTGDTIATGATTGTVLKEVSASENVFNEINDTSSGGEAVITGVDANTGSAGSHTHDINVTFAGDAVEITGDLTTDNISAQASYTPQGTVKAPVFTGQEATLEHTVTGNGPYTTSADNS